MKNDSLYNKLLLKPFLFLMLFSFWPLLNDLIILIFGYRISTYSTYLYLFAIIQISFLAFFLINFFKYLKYSKFKNYEEAHQFFLDVARVKRAEKRNRIITLKKEKELLKKVKLENEEIKRFDKG
jgi:hypothetical protein